jgi:4-amino-4-deoxy-L-arabinose transferase-like glycosyltransferase
VTTSTAPSAPAWWPVVPLCLASVLYLHAFGDAPIYLGGDEARFATAAHAIASTGRDLNGDRLPLFFHMTDSQAANDGSTRWYQPVLFYLIALVLKVLPLTESSVRIPTALVGLLDVLLMYVVARRLFQSAFYATLAALSLALTPAHLIFSRQALDYICVLPFVLGWLACLTASLDTGSVWLSLAAGLLLGLGFYSYIAAWLMTPMCLMLTWAVQRGSHPRARLASLAAGVGFACPC